MCSSQREIGKPSTINISKIIKTMRRRKLKIDDVRFYIFSDFSVKSETGFVILISSNGAL